MKDLTEGSISTHLLRMSSAQLVGMLAGTLSSLVNIYWIGKLGAMAQAAVTLAAIPVMFAMALLPIVTVGAPILASHAVGAKDQLRANRVFNEAIGITAGAALIIAAIAWSNRQSLGSALASDAETADLISTYYSWLFPSMVAQVPMLVTAGALAAVGNIKVATLAQTCALLTNVALNPIFIFGWVGLPAFGISGAGMASFIAYASVLVGLIVYLRREGSYLVLSPRTWFEWPRELWCGLRLGLPVGLESGVVAIYLMAIALLIRPFGPLEVAGFGVGQRILQAGLLPLLALSSATAIIAGHNHGAGKHGRVLESLRSGIALALLVAPAMIIALQVFPHRILAQFSEEAAVIETGAVLLRIDSFSFIPAGIAYVIVAVMSGMGNTKPALYCSAIYCVLVVAPAWCLSLLPGFSPTWIWKIMVVAATLQAVIAAHFLRRTSNVKIAGQDKRRMTA